MGEVHLYTGEGGGKTTTALGVGLRAVGHGLKVIMIQFMKGRKDIGEYKAVKKYLASLFQIYQFGREEFVDLANPSEEDKCLAKEALEFARKVVREEKPFLLILDEVNVAVRVGLLSEEEVLSFLDEIPEETHVILTGRWAPRSLVDRADLVTYMACVKHPFEGGIKARPGLEY